MPSNVKTCEDFREALIEAAAAGSEPTRELCLHLDACASCGAAFAEERQLFSAIDTGLRAAANADVPPSLLPRVRAELNARPVPRFSWVTASAAMAAVAAIVLAIILVRGMGRGAAEPNPKAVSVARNDVLVETKPSSARSALSSSAQPVRQARTRSVKISSAAKREGLAVLVPASQKRAMQVLLASVRQRKFDGSILLAEKPGRDLEELQVSPLDVSPIEVKPLADVGTEPASQNEKTSVKALENFKRSVP